MSAIATMPEIADILAAGRADRLAPKTMALRVLEDLTGVEGVEVLKGNVGPEFKDDAPVFRDVTVKVTAGHELLARLIHPRTNYIVLVPQAICGADDPVEGQPHFRILTAKDGDERRVQWFPNSLRSINEGRAMFNELVGQGMVPHRVDPATGVAGSEIMKEFDPSAGEVVFLDMAAVIGG